MGKIQEGGTSRRWKGYTKMQNEFDSPDEWDEEEPYYDWDDPDWREDWNDEEAVVPVRRVEAVAPLPARTAAVGNCIETDTRFLQKLDRN